MKNNEKKQIQQEIIRLSSRLSQNKIAKRAGVSPATISQIVNGNWKLIKADMWRKIKVKLRIDLGWNIAPTRMYRDLTELLNAAKTRHLTIAFSHKAGTGKTTFFNHYQKTVDNVIYVEGSRSMSKKSFIKALLTNCGQDTFGTTEELIQQFIDYVAGLEEPLIILDQFDKLKDGPFDLFMDFYNELYGHCAFVISGVQALQKRILNGVQRKKIGYEEIWSRMNRKFIPLYPVSLDDVKVICEHNGITDKEVISEIYNGCEGDLRRVRQEVEKHHLING